MQISELQSYLQGLVEEYKEDAAHIVAETATEYFKGSFRRKAFDGVPWRAAKRPKKKSSLLIASGALMNSIRPSHVSTERVVISAGNDKVTYAKAHNEGFVGSVSISAHQRTIKAKGRGKKRKPARTIQVKAHTRKANIPARPFMGNSRELNALIVKRIEGYIKSLE